MRRRDFIAMFGTAMTWSVAARGQSSSIPVIGWLSSVSSDASPAAPFFSRGLAKLGYVEGRNLTVDYRYAESRIERLPALAADLVQRQVQLIAAVSGLPAVLAAKAATARIPIVFVMVGDPVQSGVVASLNRPGGNLTGVTVIDTEIVMKQIELLHELLPNAAPIAVLLDPHTEATGLETSARSAGRTLNRQVMFVYASSGGDFESAVAAVVREKAAGLVVSAQPLFVSRHRQLAAVATRHAVPTVFAPADLASSGGLMSYGASVFDVFQQAGGLAGKILAGAKPAELPVEQPSRIELKINLKTARALGLEIPPAFLARADEVIE